MVPPTISVPVNPLESEGILRGPSWAPAVSPSLLSLPVGPVSGRACLAGGGGGGGEGTNGGAVAGPMQQPATSTMCTRIFFMCVCCHLYIGWSSSSFWDVPGEVSNRTLL
jgi:hypothetical protein